MRRVFAAATAVVLLLATTAPVSASDPYPGVRPDPRSDRERVAPAGRVSERGTTADATVGGTLNSLVAFSHAPYGAWPAGIRTIDPSTFMETIVTPGGTGRGDNQPAWSPGGTLIAFIRDTTSSTTDEASDIYLMQADGSGVRRLTNTTAVEYDPTWSPDGSRIAFTSNRFGNFDIYSMKIDGTDVRRLTTHAAVDAMPAWSRDGTRIAFASDRSGNADIWSMTADGASPTRLTTSSATDMEPSWSPAGSQLAFATDRTGDFEIFVMNANGTGQQNRTNDATSWDFAPTWSPDGLDIAYGGDPYGDLDVLSVPSAGGAPELIAYSYEDEFAPDWQPVPDFPLVDARFSPFEADIIWVFNQGITSGCSAERYCPIDPVTREQMAAFLDRALDLPTTTTDYFSDDETSFAEGAINRVAAAGITTGCTATTYCPYQLVTRGQMAAFLHRALT